MFPQNWERLLTVMDMPELNEDPRFADALTRLQPEQRPAFIAIFEDWLSRHTRYEAMAGIRLKRDNWVSVRDAEERHAATSSGILQRTDRQGILGQKSTDVQRSV